MSIGGWIDTHAHLCEEVFQSDLAELFQRAQEADVRRIMVIACSIEQGYQALELRKKYEFLDLAIGLHPEDVDNLNEYTIIELRELLATAGFSAVGEIGLDYYWRKDNKAKQQEIFRRQLILANEFQLPVIIHSREAASDTYRLLKEYPVQRTGVLHCYSGSAEMAREYVKLGYYISLAGPVTFKNAVNPKEVAVNTPLERLFIETDCPFMAPVPMRGKRNEPAYVAFIGKEICQLKGITENDFKQQLNQNYQSLFLSKV